jgi:hypothetical protein
MRVHSPAGTRPPWCSRPSDANLETYIFDHLEYPKGTRQDDGFEAKPGRTVWMVCKPKPAADSSEPSQDTSGSTENSQPQPTDLTVPPESSQP